MTSSVMTSWRRRTRLPGKLADHEEEEEEDEEARGRRISPQRGLYVLWLSRKL